MIIIAFCTQTSKFLPRVLCRHFRHCAPIIVRPGAQKPFVMYQFVTRRNIARVTLNARDINILRAHGWEFICVPNINPDVDARGGITCVDFTKRVIKLRHRRIQTPDALFKYLGRRGGTILS